MNITQRLTKHINLQKYRRGYSVYCLICPVKKKPIYVGLTTCISSRVRQHCNPPKDTTNRTNLQKYIRNNLRNKGLFPKFKLLFWTLNKEEGAKKEKEFILKYKEKFDILNRQLKWKN